MLVLGAAMLVLGSLVTLHMVRYLRAALGGEPAALGAIAQRVAQGDLQPVAGAASARAGSVLASLAQM